MFDATDVLIHWHPVRRRVPLDYASVKVRRTVAEKVPG